MSDDIVTRLQKSENLLRLSEVRSINAVDVIQLSSDIHDAADVIEQLRAKLIDAYDDIGRCHAAIDQLRKDNPT